MQDQAQYQEEEVKVSEGGQEEEPNSAPARSDLESADGDDVAESASVEATDATLERRQTKKISESVGQPNEESADQGYDVDEGESAQQQE